MKGRGRSLTDRRKEEIPNFQCLKSASFSSHPNENESRNIQWPTQPITYPDCVRHIWSTGLILQCRLAICQLPHCPYICNRCYEVPLNPSTIVNCFQKCKKQQGSIISKDVYYRQTSKRHLIISWRTATTRPLQKGKESMNEIGEMLNTLKETQTCNRNESSAGQIEH